MRIAKIIIASTLTALFFLSNGNIYANQFAQNQSEAAPFNDIFEVTIDGIKYSLPTPLNASDAPITIKIIEDGNTIFQRIVHTDVAVVGDGIDHRVVGDGIDHRVVGDGIDHGRKLEVSQSGIVIFNKQI